MELRVAPEATFAFLYDLMHTVTSLKSAFDAYLVQSAVRKTPATLYDPIQYVLEQPGKRVRPLLLLMAYALYRDDMRRALPAALALEYFHNFTLIHDDMMDAAALRRGVKSVHAKFGTNAAILAGDLMMIHSFDLLLSSCSEDNAQTIMGVFGDAAIQICEGQQLDLDSEEQEGVNVHEYLEIIEKKTAVLLGSALQIGALLAGAPPAQAEMLNEIGIELGKAFQIRDDVLDAYGEEALVGKRRGGDIVQKKKSILYAYAWESLAATGKNSLAEMYNKDAANPEVKIQKVLNFFDKLQVQQAAEQLGLQCFNKAAESLDYLSSLGINISTLHDFAKSLLDRQG